MKNLLSLMIGAIMAIVLMLFLTAQAEAGSSKFNKETNIITMKGETDVMLWANLRVIQKNNADKVEGIVMSGPGGRVDYMVKVMQIVKDLDVPVVIPAGDYCSSACALAAVAGKSLTVEGSLMFHMGYLPYYPLNSTLQQILSRGQSMTAGISRNMQSVGLKQAFLEDLINNTGPNMWMFVTSYSEIKDYFVKNDTVGEYMARVSGSAPYMSSEQVTNLFNKRREEGYKHVQFLPFK